MVENSLDDRNCSPLKKSHKHRGRVWNVHRNYPEMTLLYKNILVSSQFIYFPFFITPLDLSVDLGFCMLSRTECFLPWFLCTWSYHISHSSLFKWIRFLHTWYAINCYTIAALWVNFLILIKIITGLQTGGCVWKAQPLYNPSRNISNSKQSNRPFTC